MVHTITKIMYSYIQSTYYFYVFVLTCTSTYSVCTGTNIFEGIRDFRPGCQDSRWRRGPHWHCPRPSLSRASASQLGLPQCQWDALAASQSRCPGPGPCQRRLASTRSHVTGSESTHQPAQLLLALPVRTSESWLRVNLPAVANRPGPGNPAGARTEM